MIFRGRSIAAVAVIGAALVSPPAALSLSRAGSEVNFRKHWCERLSPRDLPTACGEAATYDSRPVQVSTFSSEEQRRHFRLCSMSPVGNQRCVFRVTSKVLVRDHGDVIRFDKFRFNAAFPHRVPGVYELTWRLHGSQIGRPLRFRLADLGYPPRRRGDQGS